MPIMNMMECHHNPYRAGLRYVVQGDGIIIPTNRQVCSSSLALEVLGSRRGGKDVLEPPSGLQGPCLQPSDEARSWSLGLLQHSTSLMIQ